MSESSKLHPGSVFPQMEWPKLGGGQISLGGTGGWRVLIIYRGKHCFLCKTYLEKLNGNLSGFNEIGASVFVVSADPEEKAKVDVTEFGWKFPVGFDLSVDQMHKLGLYISNPQSPVETDRPFAEPGIFVLNPEGELQIVDISNAPFMRPEVETLPRWIKLIQEKSYPIRGTLW